MNSNMFIKWWSNLSTLFLSTSIYDFVLIYVCHFHHYHLIVSQIWLSRYSCFYLGSLHPRNFGFEQTNVEHNKGFTRFTKLLIELTLTWFLWTLNKLERFYLLVIKLKHPIFGFQWSNIELWTLLVPLQSSKQFLFKAHSKLMISTLSLHRQPFCSKMHFMYRLHRLLNLLPHFSSLIFWKIGHKV